MRSFVARMSLVQWSVPAAPRIIHTQMDRTRQNLMRSVAFYLGVPLLIAVFMTLQRSGPGTVLEPGAALAFWLLTTTISWWLNDLGTRAVAATINGVRLTEAPFEIDGAQVLNAASMQSRQFPLWAVLALGALAGMLLNIPTQEWRFELFLAPDELAGLDVPMPSLSVGYGLLLLRSWSIGAFWWIGANYLFMLTFGMARYGYGLAPSATSSAPPGAPCKVPGGWLAESVEPTGRLESPVLPHRIEQSSGFELRDVLVVQAQEHYCLIRTAHARKLANISFGEALEELALLDGCQVHRSYWVARRAVRRAVRLGTGWRLQLIDDSEVPVGRTYLLDLRRRGVGADSTVG